MENGEWGEKENEKGFWGGEDNIGEEDIYIGREEKRKTLPPSF